jgi:3-dehydroquinate synthase
MSAPLNIKVHTPSKRYDVICGKGALRVATDKIANLGRSTGNFLLTSAKVRSACGRQLKRTLGSRVLTASIVFDDRESAKNLSTVEKVCRALVRAGADRKSILIAAGGGVVGDVAGFVAASYLRGVRLVHIPTTLVAQVDSSIGGKTGVNLPEGKNLAGAFYQPDLVIVDPLTLRTLPAREYRSGLYEVIKYGVIGDRSLFSCLERDLEKLLKRDEAALGYAIPRCIAAKARITSRDEKESGLREVLNFGHTFGHAIETVTRYRVFRHGEAVGWGMIAATLLGVVCTGLPVAYAARIIRLVRRVGALPLLPQCNVRKLLDAMRSDKKSRGGRLRFVVPMDIGRVKSGAEVPDDLLSTVWSELRALDRKPR